MPYKIYPVLKEPSIPPPITPIIKTGPQAVQRGSKWFAHFIERALLLMASLIKSAPTGNPDKFPKTNMADACSGNPVKRENKREIKAGSLNRPER